MNDGNKKRQEHNTDRLMPKTISSCLRQRAHDKESPNVSDSMVEIMPISMSLIHDYGFSHPNTNDI